MTTPKRSGKVNAHTYALLIAALSEGPYTRKELAEITGLFDMTVGHYVDELRRVTPKQVYIYQWEDVDPRHRVPAFKLGCAPDAKKPKPMTRKEVVDRYLEGKRLKAASIFEKGSPK